jgi:hypothetical protein
MRLAFTQNRQKGFLNVEWQDAILLTASELHIIFHPVGELVLKGGGAI